MEIKITFTDGEEETVTGYATRERENVLSVRTTHNGAYEERWTNFPLVNIKSWRRTD